MRDGERVPPCQVAVRDLTDCHSGASERSRLTAVVRFPQKSIAKSSGPSQPSGSGASRSLHGMGGALQPAFAKQPRRSFCPCMAMCPRPPPPVCPMRAPRQILVTGLPNVGKSSLIVALTRELTIERRKKGAYHLPRIEDAAGVTLGSKQHCFHEKPNMFVIDTPGLLPPEDSFKDRELYWKLQVRSGVAEDLWSCE